MGYIYILSIGENRKIGLSRSIGGRLGSYKTQNPFIEYYHLWECEHPETEEGRIHSDLAEFRQHGEWFVIPDSIFRGVLIELNKRFGKGEKVKLEHLTVRPKNQAPNTVAVDRAEKVKIRIEDLKRQIEWLESQIAEKDKQIARLDEQIIVAQQMYIDLINFGSKITEMNILIQTALKTRP